jgi:hypothetical protein
MDEKMAKVASVLSEHEEALDLFDIRVGELEDRVDDVEIRLDEVEARADGHDQQFNKVWEYIATMRAELGLPPGPAVGVALVPAPVATHPQVVPPSPATIPQVVPVDEVHQNVSAEALPVLGNMLTEDLTKSGLKAYLSALKTRPTAELVYNRITGADFGTLEFPAWLNDSVINYFVELSLERSMKHQLGIKSHLFNSHFFALLANDALPKKDALSTKTKGKFDLRKVDHGRVARWTKKINIFQEMDLVFVPVNKDNSHWCLVVIDMINTEIKAYDPAASPCDMHLEVIHKYLMEEHKVQYDGEELPKAWHTTDTTNDWNVPRQGNGCDCGVFVCMYAYYLSMGMVFHNPKPFNGVGSGDETKPPPDAVFFTQADIYGNTMDFCRTKIGLSILNKDVL